MRFACSPGCPVPVEIVRIDDRLVHGQVVVGWGQHLDLRLVILVHDEVASSDWEQELYRLGVPAEMEVVFASVGEAAERMAEWARDPRPGIVLASDIDTVRRLIDAGVEISSVTLGGLHHRPGRIQRLRYVYLTPAEEAELRALAERGVVIFAQDVPNARQVPLAELLERKS
jgi:mannose/fructose/N-acetylgalactosamine-specific phosphotransferase system component IIB